MRQPFNFISVRSHYSKYRKATTERGGWINSVPKNPTLSRPQAAKVRVGETVPPQRYTRVLGHRGTRYLVTVRRSGCLCESRDTPNGVVSGKSVVQIGTLPSVKARTLSQAFIEYLQLCSVAESPVVTLIRIANWLLLLRITRCPKK